MVAHANEKHWLLGVLEEIVVRGRRAAEADLITALTLGDLPGLNLLAAGKARNMHKAKRESVITGTGGADKAMVLGMVERGGNVRAMVVDNRRKPELQRQVREHVEAGSAIFTDALKSYDGLSSEFEHAVIDHAVEYRSALDSLLAGLAPPGRNQQALDIPDQFSRRSVEGCGFNF